MLTVYLTLCVVEQIAPSFYAVTFGGIALVVFWVETSRLWRARPV